jgi:riboflavin biosynthesis protein RibD
MQLEAAMRSALSLAKRGLGVCSPNPSVGCVILDHSNNLIGLGRTSNTGRPHAEKNALDSLTTSARGGTAIVTLEPCAHKDSSPSCAELLVNAGIKHVVIPLLDPDKRTNGKGVKLLKKSGVKVSLGILEEKSLDINAGFFFRLKYNRPLVSLKIASSLDGKIATVNGNSKWITGELSRMHGHSLRANHDVILVGINTVLKDDPKLNCRIQGSVYIADGCSIGNEVFIGPSSVLTNDRHPPSKGLWKPVIVEDGVVIGANATIVAGVRLHTGCVIAAGAVVTKDIPSQEVWGGNPAKHMMDREEYDLRRDNYE